MRNSILFIVLALFCSMNITGCSLFSSDDEDQETATISEDGSAGESDEFASDDFESSDDLDFDPEAMAKDDDVESPDELAGEDVEVEDAFGDEYEDDEYDSATTKVADAKKATDDATEDYIDDNSFGASDGSDDSLFVDEGGGIPSDTMAANQDEDLFGGADEMEPVVDTPTYDDSSYAGTDDIYDETPKFVSVKRMKPAAYKRAGGNVNRLYVVRPGDNMNSIAEKLYGDSSKSKDLYSYNSHFNGKSLKVGDKIYYESPNSPNDQTMMTYYEDNNIAPQYYTSNDGDNIRKVAKKLLGHERSWMEIYATNSNIDSKNGIPGGLQVRYWPDGTVAPAPKLAMAEPEMPEPEPIAEPEPTPEPADMAMNDPEEPDFDEEPAMDDLAEPTEVAMNDPQPENPAADDGMQEDFDPPPPTAGSVNPPPPPKPVAPPPPPPAPNANMNKPKPPKFGGAPKPNANDPLAAIGDDSMIMSALGGLLILAAIIMLIFIRRSRAKRVNFSQTQV